MTPRVIDQVTVQVMPRGTPQVTRFLKVARSYCSFADLQAAAGLKDRVLFWKTHLEPLLLAGCIERIIPDKPRSSKKKYRLTEKGRRVLGSAGGQDE